MREAKYDLHFGPLSNNKSHLISQDTYLFEVLSTNVISANFYIYNDCFVTKEYVSSRSKKYLNIMKNNFYYFIY